MKFHKKFNHSASGTYYWGERHDIPLRINFRDSEAGNSSVADPIHYHKTRTTYFCVVSGALIVEVDGIRNTVTSEAILEVAPMEKYRVLEIEKNTKYIVIGSHNEDDRIEE